MTKKRRTKRGGKAKPESIEAWAQSAADRLGGAEIRVNAIPEGKMSDIVADYASPLLDEFADFDEAAVLMLEVACLLWNMAVSRACKMDIYGEAEPVAVRILSGPPCFLDAAGALNLISAMIRRWDEEYSWCQRMIVDKQIAIRDYGPHLRIVSASLDQFKSSGKPS